MLTKNLERRLLAVPGAQRPVKLKRRGSKRDDGDGDGEGQKKADTDADADADADTDGDGDEGADADADGRGNGDGPGTIEGYAAVFHSEQDPGSEYELWADRDIRVVERIARGAFSRACREGDDCRALFNHEPGNLLGRTGSGTLRLTEDERGLRYSNDLPDTTLGRDVAELVDRGDVTGSSFGFVVEQESWRESDEPDGSRLAVRTIESVRLLDVGPVTYPAYSSTTAGRGGGDDGVDRDDEDQEEADADGQQGQEEQNEEEEGGEGEGEEEGEEKKRRRRSRRQGCHRALGSIEEARASYRRWKQGQVPLEAKLAAVRARAVQVGSGR